MSKTSEQERSVVADPKVIQMLATRDKCWSCKHKFTKPVILPVTTPTPGTLHPNINPEVLVHQLDTHGIPVAILTKQIIGMVYGLELTEFGAKGLEGMKIEV